jgi:murein DD-endopeptidase MepM/ murein hydrolase activator NlpD
MSTLFDRIKPSLPLLSWLLAGGVALMALALLGLRLINGSHRAAGMPTPIPLDFGEGGVAELQPFENARSVGGVDRAISPETIIPQRSRVEVIQYTVEFGDSLFGIADQFGVTPETLLWANFADLDDDPDSLEPGQTLNIPPVDGVYYQWQVGDTLESVANQFSSSADKIIGFSGNNLDLIDPQVEVGSFVMVPDGQREFRSWVIPDPYTAGSGVNSTALGAGACPTSYTGAGGSGSFGWPTPIHELVGNDYWSAHLAVDLATSDGVAVVAADSGVVVFAGWANGGYGYTVMLDHGNGYVTVYAHMSQVNVACGQQPGKGATVGFGGSTGNSTGPHLHFEVRYLGGFINPWTVLP